MVARRLRVVSNVRMELRFLTPDDAAVWYGLRLEMLESGPGIFSASLDDARREGLAYARERLGAGPDDDGGIIGGFASDGLIAGTVGWKRLANPKMRHKAFVWGLYVRAPYRRSGLGFDLMMRLLSTLRMQTDVEVLQLCVTSDAPAARALYERVGFQQWGHERSAMKLDGRLIDAFHYAMRVG